MGPWGRIKGMRVAVRHPTEIREIALAARSLLQVDEPNINMVKLLEHSLRQHGIHYHVVEADRIGDDAARAEPESGRILLALEAYDGLVHRVPAHQLLIPHELAHFVLEHAITFARSSTKFEHSAFEDSEVQADFFSHEFTMPASIVRRHCQSAADIQRVFNVPKQDADIRARTLYQDGSITWR